MVPPAAPAGGREALSAAASKGSASTWASETAMPWRAASKTKTVLSFGASLRSPSKSG